MRPPVISRDRDRSRPWRAPACARPERRATSSTATRSRARSRPRRRPAAAARRPPRANAGARPGTGAHRERAGHHAHRRADRDRRGRAAADGRRGGLGGRDRDARCWRPEQGCGAPPAPEVNLFVVGWGPAVDVATAEAALRSLLDELPFFPGRPVESWAAADGLAAAAWVRHADDLPYACVSERLARALLRPALPLDGRGQRPTGGRPPTRASSSTRRPPGRRRSTAASRPSPTTRPRSRSRWPPTPSAPTRSTRPLATARAGSRTAPPRCAA